MSGKTPAVFDSYAILAYLQQEDGCDVVRRYLKGGSERGGLLLNEINAGEVYYIISRNRSQVSAERFIHAILPALPITLVANTLEDVISAAKLKAAYAISYGDAFAAATAVKHKAVLVTGDPDFKQLERLIRIEWIV